MIEITREKVFEIAAALEADGKKANQRSVREVLGGGSYSTLGAMMREYREHKQQTENLKAASVPEHVTEKGSLFIATIWQAAEEAAATENVALKERVQSLTFEIKDLNEEHLAAIETIENEHATAIETIENEHKQDVEALESDHAADIASVNEVLESTRQENEQHKQDISAKDALLAEQKEEIANLRAEVKAMKKVEEMFEKVLQQKNDK